MTKAKHRRTPRRVRLVALLLAAAASLVFAGVQFLGMGSAGATTGTRGSQTVDITVDVPAMIVDNLCNGDTVNLSGTMRIITTTTPRKNGGYTVSSAMIAKDLQGERIAPPPMIGYHGDDVTNTYSYYAPPPYPSSHRVYHWTKLVPEGNAPTMYLVVVIQETTTADGTTVPVLEQTYLVCAQPKCWSERD
ncbi:MAG: hypothetical protein JOZ81_25590 [Chloroflexi bacterium]|nr:hypothetical protein [Chloroflexota bacterium]